MKRGSTPTCPHAPFKPRENIFWKKKERNSRVLTTLAITSSHSSVSRRASSINHCSPLPVGRTCRGGLIQLYCSSCPWVLCSGLLSWPRHMFSARSSSCDNGIYMQVKILHLTGPGMRYFFRALTAGRAVPNVTIQNNTWGLQTSNNIAQTKQTCTRTCRQHRYRVSVKSERDHWSLRAIRGVGHTRRVQAERTLCVPSEGCCSWYCSVERAPFSRYNQDLTIQSGPRAPTAQPRERQSAKHWNTEENRRRVPSWAGSSCRSRHRGNCLRVSKCLPQAVRPSFRT